MTVIVLDTNVVSALMQSTPDRKIAEWLDGVQAEDVWTTALTVFEVRFGIELLADGKRRRALDRAFSSALRDDFGGRIFAFDERAAELAAGFSAARRRAGRPVDMRDMQIAGIVAGRRAQLATRNTRDFADLGVKLVDPWA